MKFSEYIKEEKEIPLMGMRIDGRLITPMIKYQTWTGDFRCPSQGLTSLIGAPEEVTGDFVCSHNNLISLEGVPEKVGGHFMCDFNKLTSLKGMPKTINGDFECDRNKLTSLEYCPQILGGHIDCTHNEITSLKNIHKIIKKMNGFFYCYDNLITSHVLGLLLIPGITGISANEWWSEILNKYIDKGRAGLIDAQNELIDAELEEFAQL